MSELDPITRKENFLNAVAESTTADLEPITREEHFLDAIAGGSELPNNFGVVTREEHFLQKILDNGGAGGGGITPTGTKNISITQNGVTTENVKTYASVQITTNVPNSYEASDEGKVVDDGALVAQTSKSISANGTYDTTTNDEVVVNVPNPSTGTKSITTNGTHDVTDYASAQVNVPNSYSASDEGKVVSNGALTAQTSRTVTSNGTVDTTLNDEVVVNVPTGITPSGSQTFTENGTYDVTSLAEAVVNVASSGGGGYSYIEEYEYTHATAWNTDALGNAATFSSTYLNKGKGVYWFDINNTLIHNFSVTKGCAVVGGDNPATSQTNIYRLRNGTWALAGGGATSSSFYIGAGSTIKMWYVPYNATY